MSFCQKIQKKYETLAKMLPNIYLVVGDNDIDCAYTKKEDAEKHIKQFERKHQRVLAIDLYDSFDEA